MLRKLTFFAIIVLAVVLAGCGGGPGPKAPQAPTQLDGLPRSTSAPTIVTLSWIAPEDPSVTGYNVYRRKLGDAVFTKAGSVVAPDTIYTDTLPGNYDVEYEVTAVNAGGVQSAAAGPIFSEAPIPPPPGR